MALGGTAPAHAGTLSASDILHQFNAVIFNTFTTTADVEGRSVVGGDMTGGASFDIRPGSAGASAFAGLTVYGNETSGTTFNVNNGGGVAIGGSNAGSYNLNGGGSVAVGASNSGNINATSGNGSISVGGSNTGMLTAGTGASVFVGGSNNGGISANGGSIAVLGSNGANLTLNNAGSVYTGANSGTVSINGGTGTATVNGNNTGTLTLNNGGTATINGDTGNVTLNGGSLTYTGTLTSNPNGGGTAQQVANVSITPPSAPASTLGSFATTFQSPLTALSGQLSTMAANSTATVSGNSITLNAAPNANGVAVFNLVTSLFTNNATVTLNLDGATSVIINVNVDSCVQTACAFTFGSSVNFANPTSYASAVLWNFVNATGLTFSNEFGGTVLAPWAAVTNNGPIDGTLVANSYSGNGELHSYPYTGSLSSGGQIGGGGDSTPTPEPATLGLFGIGLAGLAAAHRRRRQTRSDR